MSAGVVLVVYFLVAAAELPDKTMIATIVMGSRNPPLLVWAGAAGGFLVQAAIAVAAGRLVELLPHQTLEIVVTTLFFLGAMLLLFVPERRARQEGEEAGERATRRRARGDGPSEPVPPAHGDHATPAMPPAKDSRGPFRRLRGGPTSGALHDEGADVRAPAVVVPWKVVSTAFLVIVVGEFGDLTQLLMVNLVGKYHEPWAVFLGGFAGLVSTSAVAAFSGRALLRWLPLQWIRVAGGLALLGFAAYGIYSLAT